MEKTADAKTIFITRVDKTRLEKLLAEEILKSKNNFKHLEGLTKELMKAKVVESKDVPSDVITMNSKVRINDLEINELREYVLVFPKEANVALNKVSVLSPIGTAMIGCRVGHVFMIKTPTGERRIMVEQILYQPEAARDYHL
jgi:regulator of nucleoside diphosphate kinase